MKEIVNRVYEQRQIELAKEILESNGYKVEKKLEEMSLSSLDTKDCLALDYFSSYREEDIEERRENYELAAEALNTSIDKILVCDEESGEIFDYIKDQEPTKIKNLLNLPGVHRGLYELKDGTRVVLMAEWGYETFYFINPKK